MRAAWLIDRRGAKGAAKEIAMIKVVAPSLQTRICDRAMQTFGAMGLSPDAPVADLWTWGRVLRIADGPDEVHLASVAKQEIREQSQNRAAASRYF